MKRSKTSLIMGGMLVLAGVSLLLQELGIIPRAGDLMGGLLFGGAGVFFLQRYWQSRSHWWMLIPGILLLSLGAVIAVNSVVPNAEWTGAIFLAGMGLCFWVVFSQNRGNWWAAIPGGVLVTLAVVSGVSPFVGPSIRNGVLFLGFGLTFVLVGMLPVPRGRMTWAYIPAGVFLGIGVMLFTPFHRLSLYIGPGVLVVLGLYFIIRGLMER